MKIFKGQTASLLNLNTPIERSAEERAVSKGEAEPRLVLCPIAAGEVRAVTLDGGGEALVIGAGVGRRCKSQTVMPVLISSSDWELLQRWKYTHLLIIRGQVRASDGSPSRPLVARFLTNTTYASNVSIRYRNGNALDLRRANIAVVPNGVLLGAKRDNAETPERSITVALRDGRVRTRRKRKVPTAVDRLERLLSGHAENSEQK